MELSQANQAYLTNLSSKKADIINNNIQKPQEQLSKEPETTKKGNNFKKALMIGTAAISAAAIAGIAIHNKRKMTPKSFAEVDMRKLYEKGFTGVIEDKIGENQDKVQIVYKKGMVRSSKKTDSSGNLIFEKIYDYTNDGEKRITTRFGDGTSETTFPWQIRSIAKDDQRKYFNLLYSMRGMDLNEIKKQRDELRFISRQQRNKIDEYIVQTEEKLRKKAQQKYTTNQNIELYKKIIANPESASLDELTSIRCEGLLCSELHNIHELIQKKLSEMAR